MWNITGRMRRELEKLAYGPPCGGYSEAGVSNPGPTVSGVLNAIGLAQTFGVGTQSQRTDAFGRIINSGLRSTSPAGNALRMIGGGVLGRAVAASITKNPVALGLGAGIGALSARRDW